MTAAYQSGQVAGSTVPPLPSAPPNSPKSDMAPWQVKSRPMTMRNRPMAYGWALFKCPVMSGELLRSGAVMGDR